MSGSRECSKYAIINGVEVVLDEVIPHAVSDLLAVVFRDASGTRRYLTYEEWEEGAKRFAAHAAARNIVTSASNNRSKVALFRSLFRGRNDMFAHGYPVKGEKPGKIGYTPSCKNENNWSVCPKKRTRNWKFPCSECDKREFNVLGDKELIAHFKGEDPEFGDVVGIYVLDENCMTSVLVADFDGDGWKRELTAYRQEGRELGIDVATERSRSGDGGHAWIFFEEPVDAGFARDLGSALLSSAMAKTGAVNFKAYDRFFPAQSSIAKGGFGSLIALPLQGWAKRNGNSVFIDDNFEEFPDQWRYLSEVRKVSRELAQHIIEQVEDGPLGPLAFAKKRPAPEIAKSDVSPGAGQMPSALVPLDQPKGLSMSDFPPVLSIVKANMLFVSKEGLSPAARNRISRLAAFHNPEFYKAQASRRSVHKIPRIIYLGEDQGDYIAIPRGCEQRLDALLDKAGAQRQKTDKRNSHAPIRVEFKGRLRENQQRAADALLKHEHGVLQAATGFGKTVVGAYLISALKMRALVIVPNTSLLDQWQKELEAFLEIDEELPPLLTPSGRKSRKKRSLVGLVGGGKSIPSGIVDIATYQSLLEKGEVEGEPKCVKALVQDYDLVICDECHRAAAPQLEKVLRSANARRVYGLSATPKREDGLEGILFMQCGPIRYVYSPKEQAADQRFARNMIPRFTRIRIKNAGWDVSFAQVLDQVCEHAARNKMIVGDVVEALSRGRTPLVITGRKNHAKLLVEKLREEGCQPYLLIGEGTGKEKAEKLRAVKSVAQSENLVIVATGSYVGEGFDLPRLDTLFLAAPYSSDLVITQYLGRLHRECDNKDEVQVHDYADTLVPMLDSMYRKRLKSYAKLGYEVVAPARGDDDAIDGMIVRASDFQTVFARDLESATKSVRIAAPYAHPKLIRILAFALKGAVERGIEVSVSIRKPSGVDGEGKAREAVQLLSSMGCKVHMVESGLFCIAIIDEETIWYGSIPLLAFARKDDCSLRFKSCEVAHDLAESEGLC